MALLAWSTVRRASEGSTYAVFSRVFCCSSSSLMPSASFIEDSFGAKIRMVNQIFQKELLLLQGRHSLGSFTIWLRLLWELEELCLKSKLLKLVFSGLGNG